MLVEATAEGRSLRALAQAFRVSHETIRKVLAEGRSRPLAEPQPVRSEPAAVAC
jgi:transposase